MPGASKAGGGLEVADEYKSAVAYTKQPFGEDATQPSSFTMKSALAYTPFTLRSGNATPFKLMGSSPAKQGALGGLFSRGGGGGQKFGGGAGGAGNIASALEQAAKMLEGVGAAAGGDQIQGGAADIAQGNVFAGTQGGGGVIPPHGDEAHTGGAMQKKSAKVGGGGLPGWV